MRNSNSPGGLKQSRALEHLDPFERPLDRHLEAQRRGFGPDAYHPDPERSDVWRITCPRCACPGRTALVLEHADGELSFVCGNGCSRVADSARSLESFWLPDRPPSDDRALHQPQRIHPDLTTDLMDVLLGLRDALDALLDVHDPRSKAGRP